MKNNGYAKFWVANKVNYGKCVRGVFMRKVKHDFQLANQEMSLRNAYMIQNCLTIFHRNSCSNCHLHAVL